MVILIDGLPCIRRSTTNVQFLCRTPAFPDERLVQITVSAAFQRSQRDLTLLARDPCARGCYTFESPDKAGRRCTDSYDGYLLASYYKLCTLGEDLPAFASSHNLMEEALSS